MIPIPTRILLINPNSNAATTRVMVAIAGRATGDGVEIIGATATKAPPMITDPEALAAAAAEVVEIASANVAGADGIVVAAFGDPGLPEIRARSPLPAAGIGEASVLEAAFGGRRFGIATTTPRLAAAIDARVEGLGLADHYTGVRIAPGDPDELAREPGRLRAALAEAVSRCVATDGAEAVVIGGGPLSQAALELQPVFRVPIIAPIGAAIRALLRHAH